MVNQISESYRIGGIQPPKPPEKSEKVERQAPARTRSSSAAQLIPELHDKVEISKEAREAAKADGITQDALPKETTAAVGNSWYSVGYKMAVEEQSDA